MRILFRQSDTSAGVCQLLVCLLLLSGTAGAGETAVEPSGNGVDLLQDTTDEGDARSSEASAAAEEFVEAVPAHPHEVPLADAVDTAEGLAAPLLLLGEEIQPGTAVRLSWSATELFEGVPVSTPVLVVNGTEPGPTLCLTAAVHGDELNGIEMVRRVLHEIDPENLSGAVIGVPIVNVQGFRRGSRYLPDRRDLNRYFPGNPSGSAAARRRSRRDPIRNAAPSAMPSAPVQNASWRARTIAPRSSSGRP